MFIPRTLVLSISIQLHTYIKAASGLYILPYVYMYNNTYKEYGMYIYPYSITVNTILLQDMMTTIKNIFYVFASTYSNG